MLDGAKRIVNKIAPPESRALTHIGPCADHFRQKVLTIIKSGISTGCNLYSKIMYKVQKLFYH